MHPLAQLTRTDVLLALALFSVRDETNGGTDETARALAALTAMEPSARAALERRASWYEQLPPAKRQEWVDHKLHLIARSRWELDETIHPSHIAQRLREEPAYVQRILLARLSAATRRAVRAALGRPEAEGDHVVEEGASADLAAVVWSAFLRHFVSLFDLARQTPVDRLSGVELARLIHLLGTRETALACRSVPEVETVAAFLRRFAAEGRPVIGVCNGFQVLCEAGLLPGALMRNLSEKFVCKTVWLAAGNRTSLWTRCVPDRPIAIPIAHGEGRYLCDEIGSRLTSTLGYSLVFDNRNFGASDGEPRQHINPWRQVWDYRDAITFAQTLPEIDAARIGVWGSSYSGGARPGAGRDRPPHQVCRLPGPTHQRPPEHPTVDPRRLHRNRAGPVRRRPQGAVRWPGAGDDPGGG